MATTKKTFTATAPDGTLLKRTSTSRDYTHCVAGQRRTGEWIARSFNGNAEIAAREADYTRRRGNFTAVAVLPVTVDVKTVAKPLDERTKRIRNLKASITRSRKWIASYEETERKYAGTSTADAYAKAAQRARDGIASAESELRQIEGGA